MAAFIKKYEKHLFIACLSLAYIMILLYNIATPYINDDLWYQLQVREADSLWDLVVQQYHGYMSWNARVVGEFILRVALVGDKLFFNIANSAVFVALIYLIFVNIISVIKLIIIQSDFIIINIRNFR
jgi:hypothetical protein